MKFTNLLVLTIVSFVTCAAVPAFARTVEDEVTELLVTEAGSITLLGETGQPLPNEQQLPALMANSLRGGYLSLSGNPSSAVLHDLSVICRNVTPPTLLGAVHYTCDINFVDGTFPIKGSKLETSPQDESSVNFQLELTRAVYPNAKYVIKSKQIKVGFAG